MKCHPVQAFHLSFFLKSCFAKKSKTFLLYFRLSSPQSFCWYILFPVPTSFLDITPLAMKCNFARLSPNLNDQLYYGFSQVCIQLQKPTEVTSYFTPQFAHLPSRLNAKLLELRLAWEVCVFVSPVCTVSLVGSLACIQFRSLNLAIFSSPPAFPRSPR